MPVGSGPVRWDDAWVPHRRELQGLRAVAVLLVVLDHAGLPFLQGGYVGVDVFFVLSGYLITGLLLSPGAAATGASRSPTSMSAARGASCRRRC